MSTAPTPAYRESIRSGFAQRVYAVVEVLIVFAATHVLMKCFKQFTHLGTLEREARLNFSPGLCMAGVAVLILLVRRRPWRDYGFQWPGLWRDRRWSLRAVVTFALLYVCPLLLLVHFNSKTGHVLLNYIGTLTTVSLGEEIFFRGYMQSRLNEVFEKRWAVRGIRFGAGLVVANLVFGLMHGLNTVDYFHGHYTFDWVWAIGSLVNGFVFGLIREATDSVWPGGMTHGLWDIWVYSLRPLLRGI